MAIPIQRVTPHIHVLRPLGQMNTLVFICSSSLPANLVDRSAISPHFENNRQTTLSHREAERQGLRLVPPWPARGCASFRCPNSLLANLVEPWNTREDVTGIPVQRVTPHIHVLRPLGQMNTFVFICSSLLPANLVDRSAISPKPTNAVGRAALISRISGCARGNGRAFYQANPIPAACIASRTWG